MRKTTVYLADNEAAALRRLAAHSGRSQAQIIREAIASVTREAQPRDFHFFGAGRGSGEPVGEHADEIVREEWGKRPR